jgi:hypothetical protein
MPEASPFYFMLSDFRLSVPFPPDMDLKSPNFFRYIFHRYFLDIPMYDRAGLNARGRYIFDFLGYFFVLQGEKWLIIFEER